MTTIVEQIAPPVRVRAELAYFQTHSFAELVEAAKSDPLFSASVTLLGNDLQRLINRCSDDLSVRETVTIVDAWDHWCERYEVLEHPVFEELLLDVFVALPS